MNGDGIESADSVVLNRFMYLINRLHLEPKALITYEREAFFDPDNPDLRITFDYNVRSFLNPTLRLKNPNLLMLLSHTTSISMKGSEVVKCLTGEIVKSSFGVSWCQVFREADSMFDVLSVLCFGHVKIPTKC